MNKKGIFTVLIGVIAAFGATWFFWSHSSSVSYSSASSVQTTAAATTPTAPTNSVVESTSSRASLVTQIPDEALLPATYYAAQTFNNCGPAALSMYVSFFGISESQQAIADDVRPDNNLTGKDDDKSTAPDALVAEAEKFGLVGYFRPGGSPQLLEQFVANGIPVMVRTLFMTTPTEDYAHYRVVKGYNKTTDTIIEEDGFSGPNITFSFNDFMNLWQHYDYEYMVMVPPDKEAIAEAIMGKDANETTAWQDAANAASAELQTDPNNAVAELNLSVADYYIGNYQGSVDEYQAVASSLSPHALWYQIEPIESYEALGDYSQVFTLTNDILDDNNPAYPELYVLQGEAYEKEEDTTEAKASFEKALYYNKNLVSAQQALQQVSS